MLSSSPSRSLLGAMLTLNDGTLATFLAEMFPTRVRYTGFAVASTSPTPSSVARPRSWRPSSSPPQATTWPRRLVLVAAAIVSLIAVALSRETSREPLTHG